MVRARKTVVEEYFYNSMEEKLEHAEKMKKRGFESTEQLFENMVLVNTQLSPRRAPYGRYIKVDNELKIYGDDSKL